MYSQATIIITKRWKLIVLAGIILAVVSGLITLIFPLKYRADAQVLVISKSRFGTDPYTTVKSAETIGENLAQIMTTNDFFGKVINQPGYDIDKTYFENVSERTKRIRWEKTISPSVVYGTGMLNVSAYSTNPDQALQIAGASVTALTLQGWEYVGEDVAMKTVNEPVVTRFPVRPNILINIGVGFVVGLLGMALAMVRKYRNLV